MREVPALPRTLGLAGLLPQFAALGVLIAGPAEWRAAAQVLAIGYAALELSHVGGAWWGLAASAPAAERRGGLAFLWLAAVAAVTLSLACLVLLAVEAAPPEPLLIALGAALLMSLGVDAKLGALAPRWWMRLRVPLSIALGGATMAAAWA